MLKANKNVAYPRAGKHTVKKIACWRKKHKGLGRYVYVCIYYISSYHLYFLSFSLKQLVKSMEKLQSKKKLIQFLDKWKSKKVRREKVCNKYISRWSIYILNRKVTSTNIKWKQKIRIDCLNGCRERNKGLGDG